MTTLLVSISALGFFLLLVQRFALAVALRHAVPGLMKRLSFMVSVMLVGTAVHTLRALQRLRS